VLRGWSVTGCTIATRPITTWTIAARLVAARRGTCFATAKQAFGELRNVTQTPPIRHAFAPDQRVGIDATCVEGTHELPEIHRDGLPARDVHEPAHRALNRPRRL
jgi:hypothetical protein